jgi:hypothetical protein
MALGLLTPAVRAAVPVRFGVLLLDKLAGSLHNIHGLAGLSVVD